MGRGGRSGGGRRAAGRGGLVVVACAAALVAAAPAGAAELVVTRTDDDVGCTPGGVCHLRGAVIAANASAEADTIVLPAGRYVLTRVGDDTTANGGDLDVNAAGGPLTIAGAGARGTTIDAAGIPTAERVLETFPGSTLVLADLTLTGGDPDDDGAGLMSRGTTSLERVAVVANHTDPDGLNDGGGIDNNGTMTVVDSLVAGNSSSAGGGGIEQDGSLTLVNVTISGNATAGAEGGGGIDNDGDNAPLVAPGVRRGSLSVTHSTITGNSSASSEGGGGITTEGGSSTAPATFRGTVVAGNTATTGPANCVTSDLHSSEGGNVEDTGECGFTAAADRTDADPRLGALTDNGGPTDTHALGPGSAAIDAGAGCPPPAGDQRGVARPQGAACDSGAFEAVPAAANPGEDPPPPGAPPPGQGTGAPGPPPAQGAGQPRPPADTRPPLPPFSRAVVLPSSRRCVSRRRFRIRIRELPGVTYVSARVFVNGRRVRVLRGRRLRAPVDLRGLPRGRFTVRIEVRLADGRTIRGSRRYRTCTPKRRSGRAPRL